MLPLCSFQGALPVRFQPASNRPFDRSILWPVENFRTESSLSRFLKTIQKSSEAIRTFSPLAFASVDPRPRQFLAASRRILPFLRSRFRARFSGCRSVPASPSESPLRLSAPLPLGRPGIRSGSDSTVLRLHSCFSFTLASLPRKEVIQPHLPIRLPCYDFTPVIGLTFDGCPLSVSSPASGAPNSHGVTGGVYKARERIHRGMLIRDY